MDTNVVDAALRSRLGWSYELLTALRNERWVAVVSNHLLHEYEEVLKSHAEELRLSLRDVDDILDLICARAELWPLSGGWIPLLRDADDEPLVQLAFESSTKCVVTHNLRHIAPARGLGIDVLSPREFMRIVAAQ